MGEAPSLRKKDARDVLGMEWQLAENGVAALYIPAITITWLKPRSGCWLRHNAVFNGRHCEAGRVTRYTRPSQHISRQIFQMP